MYVGKNASPRRLLSVSRAPGFSESNDVWPNITWLFDKSKLVLLEGCTLHPIVSVTVSNRAGRCRRNQVFLANLELEKGMSGWVTQSATSYSLL